MPEETVVTVLCGQTVRDYSLPLWEPIVSWFSFLMMDLLPGAKQAALVFQGEALDLTKSKRSSKPSRAACFMISAATREPVCGG